MTQRPPNSSVPSGAGHPGEDWSRQQPQPPYEGPPQGANAQQPVDPWEAAQQSDFVYRPEFSQGPQPGGSWGAAPGTRADTDPDAWRKVAPAHKVTPDEVKTGNRLAIGCGVVGIVVVAIAIVTVALFYRSAAKSGLEAVEAGIAMRTKLQLDQAVRTEQTYFAQFDQYTDDPRALKVANPQLTFVNGIEVQNPVDIAVQMCGGDAVILQKKANDKVYFAVLMSKGAGGVPYYAAGQQVCPEGFDATATSPPPPPWSSDQGVLGVKGAPDAPAVPPVPAAPVVPPQTATTSGPGARPTGYGSSTSGDSIGDTGSGSR